MEGHYLDRGTGFAASNSLWPVEYFNQKLKVTYEPGTEILSVKWEGAVSSEEIRSGYKAILNIIRDIRPKKWIIDVHQREQIRSDDQRWVFENVFAKALRLLNCDIFVAVILPVQSYHLLVNELNGDELIYKGHLLIISHFLYEEEGRRWLDDVTVLK